MLTGGSQGQQDIAGTAQDGGGAFGAGCRGSGVWESTVLGRSCGVPGIWGAQRARGWHVGKGSCCRQVAGEYPREGESMGQAAPGRQGKERRCAVGTATHLHDVELGQQVAVSRRELVAVEEAALGGAEVGLSGQLMLQGCAQVLIQLQQSLQQVPLQRCGAAAVRSQSSRQPPAPALPALRLHRSRLAQAAAAPHGTEGHDLPPSSSPSS